MVKRTPAKRAPTKKNIARGCGKIKEGKRKVTKYI